MKEFDKIIGYGDVKAELEKLCDIMVNSEKYKNLGVTTPGGLLLHGDPGVGKTLMANCLIKASGRKSFILHKDKPNGDFVNEIKRVFDDARANAPSIIFLDDLDKFANEDRYHRNAEEYVTVQSCIDECKGCDVFVLATANDYDNLPDSLCRAGRFDKVIEVKNPRGDDAVEIVRYYLSQKNYVGDIDAKEIARILNGNSCAELETVINQAGIYAGYAGKQTIEMDDMIKACMDVIFDCSESARDMRPAADIERLAYHEAGHVVITELLEEGSTTLVSICNHGGNIDGVAAYYQNESYFYYKKYMENRVMGLLGGKAATEVKYGETDVGCRNDLDRAFEIAKRFADAYCSTSFDRWETENSSQALIERKEMQKTVEVEHLYAKTRKLLILNREFLDKVASALIEKKTLIARDIAAIKATCKITME